MKYLPPEVEDAETIITLAIYSFWVAKQVVKTYRAKAPGFVTVLLFSFVFTWNNYFLPLVVLNDPTLYPLTVGLASWNDQASAGGGAQAVFPLVITGALVGIVPIIVVFLFLQRFWQGGLTFGSLK